MKKENIVLIGFMGCGKSTIGRKLANAIGYEFLDTDELIEQKTGRKISDIFASDGEEVFRQMETDLLQELSETVTGKVLATGGGMPMREENRALMRQVGTVVFLEASIKTILERLANDTTRPLAAGKDREKRLRPLYEKRYPLYREAAEVVVDTEGKSFYGILEELIPLKKTETEENR
jgi:shikimate kinase